MAVNHPTMANTEGPNSSFLDYVHLLLRWRKFIITTVGCVAVLSVVISLLLPKWFKSTASILPPADQGVLNPLGSASSMLKGLAAVKSLGSFGQGLGAYNYFAILRSRSAMEAVINKFNLREVYDVQDKPIEDVLQELEGNVDFQIEEEDYISVSVYDKDPQRAADMANYYVDLLNEISIRLGTQEARNNREFIGSRVKEVQEVLRIAEDSLQSYQERSGMLMPPTTEGSGIAPIAELYGLKARKEIELGIAKREGTSVNLLARQLQMQLSEIEKKLKTFPGAGVTSMRFYREIAIQQTILEFLVPMYEQARVEEQKDIPVILVLDRAVPAEEKASPKRMIIVALSTLAASLFSILIVAFRERLARLSSQADSGEKMKSIRDIFRSSVSFRFSRKDPSNS
jgi:uncharacterized protein involved in exopolysaccharide biosynthesis